MALPKKRSKDNNDKWIKNDSATGRFLNRSEELSKNLRLDTKKRITLGKLAADEVTSYDAEIKENGVIILHPKVEIPAEELWLWKNKDAMASIRSGLDDLASGRFEKLPEDYWNDLEE